MKEKASIVNIIPPINIGFDIPNVKRMVNTVAHVLGIQNVVHVMPMKLNFDANAYAVKQGCEYIIFVNEKILRSDKINNFNIRMFIHEMWHVKQMMEGRLKFNYDNTKAIYNGVEYTNLVAHENRPFEVEARRAEGVYFKQVKKLL
ncbi:MAG: hypothetical protein GX163_04890 [Bacteroidetes bacterium]|nr:hypothetical protein [Bacteroidota bacterium]